MTTTPYHVPVLLPAVLDAAGTARRVVDCTLGGGGHAAALLARGDTVLGIDRDPEAIAAAAARLGQERITYLHAGFADRVALEAARAFAPDFVLLDLGVSSHQLDDEGRGFSFRMGAPLDMRMSRTGPTGADLLNDGSEEELRQVFQEYGDERRAGRLAREVIRRRATAPFRVSDDFVNAIRAVLGPRSGPPDFARLFQALRVAVNAELEQLAQALPELRDALTRGGRLAVISYHSGEDRVVKHAFQEWARACVCPPEALVCTCRGHALGHMPSRKPIVPPAGEISTNPRARSAKLRVFQVTDDV